MKRFVLISLLFLITPLLFSEPIYKEFIIDGEKIYKWVNKTSVLVEEYDSNGNIIHSKESFDYGSGFRFSFQYWYEYDANGNMIHEKSFDGKEYRYEYDSNGNMIHEKKSDGDEDWYVYDSNGNMIYRISSDGYCDEYEYYPDKKIKSKYEFI